MDDWLKSFSVALGFQVDTGSLNTAKKSIADYEAAVKAAEKRIEDARWAGAKSEQEIAKLTMETNLKEARAALAAAEQREKGEQEAARKRDARHKEFMAGMSKLALAATAMATAVSYAANAVTRSFDSLGFVSQRTGASVQALNSLGYAFKQVGGTSEQAISAVESFSKALRENSGVKSFVEGLGVDTTKDTAQQLLDTVEKLNKEPYDVGFRYAGLAGISEENYQLITKQGEALRRYKAERDALTKDLGVNEEAAARASMDFQRSLTRLQATVSILSDKLLVSLAPALKAIVDRFQDWIRSNPEKVERIMDGISKAVVWVAEKIGALVQSFTGANGDAFMKRWEAFGDRIRQFADNIERIANGIEKIARFLNWASGTKTPLGDPQRTADILNQMRRDRGDTDVPAVVVTPGASPGPVRDRRSWWQRHAPTALGGQSDPNAPERTGLRRRGDRNAEAIGRLNPRAAEGPGRYRPEYKLSDADLSQRTADIIAGEAIRRNPESIDAVINNMLNRVGSKGWGPSRNLQEVATAPGQYEAAWKGSGASPSETEFIRSRIRAIASGGIPDNTNGSNAFRASGYRGPWFQRNANAPVVGGNRFGYEPGVPNGPYAPYSTPKDVPPPKPADASAFPIKVTAPKIEIRGAEGASALPQIRIPQRMDPGGFDVNALLRPDPAISSAVQNSTVTNNRAVHQTFNTKTTITGADRPQESARVMEKAFSRMHDLALMNAQSATV
ncbi:hypothetical protein ACQKQD_07655 [Methylobacterium sp. NPDC080182]|uniref:hypothetical protein n=1 Tax=Methylobacterium sp. NPDC080182 TaxID=3390590 RepID=UPI003CFDCCA7